MYSVTGILETIRYEDYAQYNLTACLRQLIGSGCAKGNKSYDLYDKYGGYPTGRIEKNADGAYYVYDSKAGGYPSGRIEKKGNTYYLYNGKSGGYPVGRVMRK